MCKFTMGLVFRNIGKFCMRAHYLQSANNLREADRTGHVGCLVVCSLIGEACRY